MTELTKLQQAVIEWILNHLSVEDIRERLGDTNYALGDFPFSYEELEEEVYDNFPAEDVLKIGALSQKCDPDFEIGLLHWYVWGEYGKYLRMVSYEDAKKFMNLELLASMMIDSYDLTEDDIGKIGDKVYGC